MPSEVAREDYIQIAARILNVDAMAAMRDFKKAQNTQRRPVQNQTPEAPQPAKDPLLTQATWELLWLLLHFPEYGQRIAETLDYEWISSKSPAGQLLARLIAEYREGMVDETTNIEALIESIEDRQLLAEIHTRDLSIENPKAEIANCLKTLYRNYLNNRKKELELKIANTDSKAPEQIELMRERKSIKEQLANYTSIQL